MDNETPKYASWIPTAGGYVADGKVVSTSPQYDEQGKFKVDVDTSLFAGQPQTQAQATQIAAQPTSGITTANTSGSGQDVNATITGIGSLASISENTGKSTTGVLDTQASKSPVAGNVVNSELQQVLQDYAYDVATDNIQGQINRLVRISELTGQDFTSQIDKLAQARVDKINNINNDYTTKYNQAIAEGDFTKANQILNEQQKWFESVSTAPPTSIAESYEQEKNEIEYKWKDDYLSGINEITGMLVQLTGNVLNFRYDPTKDAALHVAQGYAINRVKETMNASGLYFSSMTTSAITKAVAELVPVYEKMARDEMVQNLNVLQSTANFLMNLESQQFNMWRSQIELQFEANNEKRKEVAAAWERANNIGYVDNQASAILGVPAGTLSPNAREHLQALQESIAAENRSLIQSMTLADYKNELEKDRMQEEERLNEKYWNYQANNPKTTGDGTGEGGTKVKIVKNADGTISVTEETTLNRPLTEEEQADINENNQQAEANKPDYVGKMTAEDLVGALSTTSELDNSSKVQMLEYIKKNAKSEAAAGEAAGKITQGNNKTEVFDKDILVASGIDGLIAYYKALDTNRFFEPVEGTDATLYDMYNQKYGATKNNVGLVSILMSDAKNKDIMINKYIKAVVNPQIESTKLGSYSTETRRNQNKTQEMIGDYASALLDPEFYKSSYIKYVSNMYKTLADKIVSTPNYDTSEFSVDQGKSSMAKGIQNIIVGIRTTEKSLGNSVINDVTKTWSSAWKQVENDVSEYAKQLESDGKIKGWEKISKNYSGY